MVDTIEHGTIASVHYTGTFAEGGEFDSSRGKDPLVFIVGYGQMITGFEREMLGAKVRRGSSPCRLKMLTGRE